MEPVEHHAGHVRQPFGGPLDLGDAGEEGEHPARFLAQRGADCRRHRILDPVFGIPPDMAQLQRMAAAFALDHRGAPHQRREACPVERGGHRHQPQIGPQRRLRVERERETEIAVEAALMDFVEQHCGDAGQLGIGLDAIDENAFGENGHARRGAAPAVHPGGIAEGPADRLARQARHPLGGGARGEAARREQQNFAAAPVLAEQRRRHCGGLARAGRRHQHGINIFPQRSAHLAKHRMDR